MTVYEREVIKSVTYYWMVMKIAILEIAFCISQGIYTPEKKKIKYSKFLFVATEIYCLDLDYNSRCYKKNLFIEFYII